MRDEQCESVSKPSSLAGPSIPAQSGTETSLGLYQSFLNLESNIQPIATAMQHQTAVDSPGIEVALSALSTEMEHIIEFASKAYDDYRQTATSITSRYNSELEQARKRRDDELERAERDLRNAEATAARLNKESQAANERKRSEAKKSAQERLDYAIGSSPAREALDRAKTEAGKGSVLSDVLGRAATIGAWIIGVLLAIVWFFSALSSVSNPILGFIWAVIAAIFGVIVGAIAGAFAGAIVGLVWMPFGSASASRRRSQALLYAEEEYNRIVRNGKDKCTNSIQAAEESYSRAAKKASDDFNLATAIAREGYNSITQKSSDDYELQVSSACAKYVQSIDELNTRCQRAGTEIRQRISKLSTVVNEFQPNWSAFASNRYIPTGSVLPLVRLGTGSTFAGMRDSDLVVDKLPILVDAPHGLSILFRQNGPARAHVPEAFLLRLVTSFPPGKLRLTLIDPVGLGRNVASLMSLADHDSNLITDQAWVEPRHIEQRLAALSEQMQTIIQKYLKRDFETMEDYNKAAGNVEEPYRVLVVNNFPTNFTSEALRHLINIMTVGPRCGVYTLLSIDDTQKRPYDFNLNDLTAAASMIVQQVSLDDTEVYSIRDAQMHTCMVQFEQLPNADVIKTLTARIGKQALTNSVVQVPFAETIPARANWWESKSMDRITASVGFHGARKNLMLTLGKNEKGDDLLNSALVVGRVGSGKSNLLHVLIMSLALKYSPEELEFYLIDSKQGVEFKTYAVHQLPHARAISVETEREFIFSVLKRLDTELERRGELFRNATEELGESANIAKYRKLTGEPLPRILLIADEFQELFAEDDALSRTSTTLLEKLVRQGRAYGIHIMLSTQSLAGGHGLNNQTRGLMALRVALMSSDADSRLILSDDNPEARLLNRPGEAIYNDKFGQLEGNHRFQTSWLTTEDRDEYLDQLSAMARERFPDLPEPIVFEGNRPADITKNPRFDELMSADGVPISLKTIPVAWLGEPVAITNPTGAPLPRQAGSNLLIVGQDEETAYNMLAMSLIGLLRHHELANDGASFHLVDLGPVDSPNADTLQRITALFPGQITVAQRRRLTNVVGSIYREMEHRLEQDDDRGLKPVYLVVASLQRARDLREQDDYGAFPTGEGTLTLPSHDQFMKIIREGPEVGIHVLTWCDTLNNAVRTIERRGLGEFDAKVLMQMSPDDSSALIDARDAAKLGGNRALLYSDDRSSLEKFRPYGRPSDELLAKVESRNRPVLVDVVPDGSKPSTNGSAHELSV